MMKQIHTYITIVCLTFSIFSTEAQSIRKNFTEMTQAEKDALVNAFYQLRTGQDLINDLASFHNANFGPGPNTIHNNLPQNDVFLAWHRRQILEVELAMQDINENLSIPYWDETTNNSPSDPLWDDNFLGQFDAAWNLDRTLGAFLRLPNSSDVNAVQDLTIFYAASSDRSSNNYVPRLEGGTVHTGAHNWVGGVMRLGNSPLDPIFYLHHSFVDKLWQEWQEIYGTSGFIKTNMPRYDGTYTFDGTTLPSVNPNNIVDSKSIGVFYAENQLAVMDNYEVKNLYRSTEKFYYQYVIEAGNNFKVPSGRNCTFESTIQITLKPGFSAHSGSNFTAKIDKDKNLNTSARKPMIITKVAKPFKNVHNVAIKENAYLFDTELKKQELEKYSLNNYPNPFSNNTIIEFLVLEENVTVSLVVLNVIGERVAILLNKERKERGINRVEFNGKALPRGIYYYAISIGNYSETKKMILVK